MLRNMRKGRFPTCALQRVKVKTLITRFNRSSICSMFQSFFCQWLNEKPERVSMLTARAEANTFVHCIASTKLMNWESFPCSSDEESSGGCDLKAWRSRETDWPWCLGENDGNVNHRNACQSLLGGVYGRGHLVFSFKSIKPPSGVTCLRGSMCSPSRCQAEPRQK